MNIVDKPLDSSRFDGPKGPKIIMSLNKIYRNDEISWKVYQALHRKWSQVNDETGLKLLQDVEHDRLYAYVELPSSTIVRRYAPHWYPQAGLKAFLKRFKLQTHQWLVEHDLRPSRRLRKLDISDLSKHGFIDLNIGGYVPIARLLPIKIEIFGYAYYDYRISMIAAYDPLTDTLFYRVS